ncbi:MAG: hypothetical protein LBC56_06580 [Oscillospiraceae bacterium]|jgi:hypothetical protein|nr:hypothetical protein [Oscillospiraceae bacterium]
MPGEYIIINIWSLILLIIFSCTGLFCLARFVLEKIVQSEEKNSEAEIYIALRVGPKTKDPEYLIRTFAINFRADGMNPDLLAVCGLGLSEEMESIILSVAAENGLAYIKQ